MPRFRVTYTDGALRECFIEAKSPGDAEEIARAEFDNGQRHHMVDGWYDDWQAVPIPNTNNKSQLCVECGKYPRPPPPMEFHRGLFLCAANKTSTHLGISHQQ